MAAAEATADAGGALLKARAVLEGTAGVSFMMGAVVLCTGGVAFVTGTVASCTGDAVGDMRSDVTRTGLGLVVIGSAVETWRFLLGATVSFRAVGVG